MKRAVFACSIALLMLAGCATSPPVQEMAAARSAIQTAKSIESDNPRAQQELKSAEQSLKDAADAIRNERYEHARQLAISAKSKAQNAARIKQRH